MKSIINISPKLKKLLFMVLAVMFLSACSDNPTEVVVGGTCDSEETCEKCESCIDVRDSACLSCRIISIMYDAVGSNVGRLHSDFTKASMPIVMIGFSIWLALRLLKFVSSATEVNIREVWNEILRKAFICFICGFLASSPETLMYVINTLVFPVYKAFIDLGLKILESSLEGNKDQVLSFTAFGTQINVQNVNIACSLGSNFTASNTGFPSDIRDAINCQILALTRYLTIGGDIANKAMKYVGGFFPRMLGFVLWIFFKFVNIMFVFYLVDMIFQMGIIILLLPIYVVSYAFGPTKKWATTGFKQMLTSAAFLMCFSIIVALVLRAMVELIANNPTIFNPEDLDASLSDLSVGLICLLLIGFLIYKSLEVATELTSGLIGVSVNTEFQKKLKAMVQATGEAIWSGLGAIVSWGASLLPQSSFKTIRSIHSHVKATKAKVNRLTGRDLD